MLGLLLFLTAGPVGYRFETIGVRLALLGGLVLAFAASGSLAFD